MNPLVSIVIPVYNGSAYLAEAIDSALGQTYNPIEVLVVNDGSGDDGKTEAIAKAYCDRIRYFHKQNGGVATALNLGIREMRGEYFSWLSHDDVYHQHKIEAQMKCLADRNEPVVMYSDCEYIDCESRSIPGHELRKVSSKDFIYNLIVYHIIHGCTALVPRKIFDDVGLFNEKLRTTQDYEMWFRIALRYDFVFMPEILIKSRLHAEQGTNSMSDLHAIEKCELYRWMLTELKKKSVDPDLPVRLLHLARALYEHGYPCEARLAGRLATSRPYRYDLRIYVCAMNVLSGVTLKLGMTALRKLRTRIKKLVTIS